MFEKEVLTKWLTLHWEGNDAILEAGKVECNLDSKDLSALRDAIDRRIKKNVCMEMFHTDTAGNKFRTKIEQLSEHHFYWEIDSDKRTEVFDSAETLEQALADSKNSLNKLLEEAKCLKSE